MSSRLSASLHTRRNQSRMRFARMCRSRKDSCLRLMLLRERGRARLLGLLALRTRMLRKRCVWWRNRWKDIKEVQKCRAAPRACAGGGGRRRGVYTYHEKRHRLIDDRRLCGLRYAWQDGCVFMCCHRMHGKDWAAIPLDWTGLLSQNCTDVGVGLAADSVATYAFVSNSGIKCTNTTCKNSSLDFSSIRPARHLQ
jgi:hypothetical protein